MPSLTGSTLSLVSCVGLLFSWSAHDWYDQEMPPVGSHSLHVLPHSFSVEEAAFVEPPKVFEASLEVVDLECVNADDRVSISELTDASTRKQKVQGALERAITQEHWLFFLFVVAIVMDLFIGGVVLSRLASLTCISGAVILFHSICSFEALLTFVPCRRQRSSLPCISSSDNANQISDSPGTLPSVAGQVDMESSEQECHSRVEVDHLVMPLESGSEALRIEFLQPHTDSCSGIRTFAGLDCSSNMIEINQQCKPIVQQLDEHISGIACTLNVGNNDPREPNEQTFDAPAESVAKASVKEAYTLNSMHAAKSEDSVGYLTCTGQDRTQVPPTAKAISRLCRAGFTLHETGAEKFEMTSNDSRDVLSSIRLGVPTPARNESKVRARRRVSKDDNSS